MKYQIYEISIFNEQVRNLVEIGESHRNLDDSWADQRYIQIKAPNKERALSELARRYPERQGYVHASIVEFED